MENALVLNGLALLIIVSVIANGYLLIREYRCRRRFLSDVKRETARTVAELLELVESRKKSWAGGKNC